MHIVSSIFVNCGVFFSNVLHPFYTFYLKIIPSEGQHGFTSLGLGNHMLWRTWVGWRFLLRQLIWLINTNFIHRGGSNQCNQQTLILSDSEDFRCESQGLFTESEEVTLMCLLTIALTVQTVMLIHAHTGLGKCAWKTNLGGAKDMAICQWNYGGYIWQCESLKFLW